MTEPLKLWRNARLATCDDGAGRSSAGRCSRAARASSGSGAESRTAARARACGWCTTSAAPGSRRGSSTATPTWCSPATRAGEYAQRLRGRSYEEIARAGGGILSTVRAVRAASEQQLFDESAPRLPASLAEGVTTIEIKSGYGLTLDDEAKMLRVARALAAPSRSRCAPRSCAAHTAAGVRGRADAYIDTIAREWLPALPQRGADRCGGRVLREHRLQRGAGASACSTPRGRLGLPVKMHAEQLANLGGDAHGHHAPRALLRSPGVSPRAAEAAALAALARWRCSCRWPSTAWPMSASRRWQRFARAGAAMAVASDCNPGSAPGTSLLLGYEHGDAAVRTHRRRGARRRHPRMPPARSALRSERGTLACGQAADFVVWNVRCLEELELLDWLQPPPDRGPRGRGIAMVRRSTP